VPIVDIKIEQELERELELGDMSSVKRSFDQALSASEIVRISLTDFEIDSGE
jgi:hypothetical protein